MSTEGTSTGKSSDDSSGEKKRKGRGPNRLDYEKMSTVKATEIQINEVGQPIGQNSVIYSSGYGALAAQMIPITYMSWDKIPQSLKDTVWENVKLRFGVDNSMKVQTLKAMNDCWRHYKGKITKQIRDISSGLDAQRRYEMLKPPNVSEQDWIAFVNHRLSSEFEATSKHFSELSKKNVTPHTSRKGMARLREDLKAKKVAENKDPEVDRVETWIASHMHKDGRTVNQDVAKKIEQIGTLHQEFQSSLGDDAIAQVLGPEHQGQVRGMGHGVTPSAVCGSVIGRQNFAQYQQHIDSEMAALKQTVTNLTNLLMTHLPNVDQTQILACMPPVQPTQYSSGSNSMGSSKSVACTKPSTKSKSRGSTSQACGSSGNHCKLLDWFGIGTMVAEAEIDSKDPYDQVYHEELGPDYWRVSVKKVIVSIPLPRPTNELQTLEHALHSFIAWPIKYIVC